MKEKIARVLTYFIFRFVLLIVVFSSVLSIFQKEKPKKEETSDTKKQPHIAENQYFGQFQGRNPIIKSISTSASTSSTSDSFLNREL